MSKFHNPYFKAYIELKCSLRFFIHPEFEPSIPGKEPILHRRTTTVLTAQAIEYCIEKPLVVSSSTGCR